MSAKNKKISVDEETYAEILAYRCKISALAGKEIGIGEAAERLIHSGLRHEGAGMWDSEFARALRNAMREVAEADRLDREMQLRASIADLEGSVLCSRAALFAVLTVLGCSNEDIKLQYEAALELVARI